MCMYVLRKQVHVGFFRQSFTVGLHTGAKTLVPIQNSFFWNTLNVLLQVSYGYMYRYLNVHTCTCNAEQHTYMYMYQGSLWQKRDRLLYIEFTPSKQCSVLSKRHPVFLQLAQGWKINRTNCALLLKMNPPTCTVCAVVQLRTCPSATLITELKHSITPQ